jgi:hypothetical protein
MKLSELIDAFGKINLATRGDPEMPKWHEEVIFVFDFKDH